MFSGDITIILSANTDTSGSGSPSFPTMPSTNSRISGVRASSSHCCIGPRTTKFEETVLGDERVVIESAKFVCIRVDCDKDEEAMKKFGVDSPPACVFAKGDGDKIADLEARDAEKAARQMAEVAENFKK